MTRKTFPFYRLRYFLLPLLLFGSVPAHSQSAILSGNQCSEHSIIRNYANNVDITFNVMLDTQTFNYVDRNTMTTSSVYIYDFGVDDFVVFHDSVFFCGSIGSTACYGYFDINDVFFSSGSITYYELFFSTMFDPARSILFGLEKIDVTTSRSGNTHLLMVGRGYNYDVNITFMESHYYYPGAIVEAWTDSSGTQRMRYTIDYDYNYIYTDVAFTGNYAVVSASTTDELFSNTHNLFYYKNPTYSSEGYLDSWSSSFTPTMTADASILSLPPYGSNMIHITKMQKDSFATACINYFSGNITVSIYQDPTQLPIKRIDIPHSVNCKEIIYNPLQESLYYISISPSPTSSYDLFQIKNPYTSSLRLIEGASRWLSLDNTDNKRRVILSGFDFSTYFIYPKKYWLFDETDLNGCFLREEVPNVELGKTDLEGLYIQNTIRDNRPPVRLQSKSFKYNLEYLCQ